MTISLVPPPYIVELKRGEYIRKLMECAVSHKKTDFEKIQETLLADQFKELDFDERRLVISFLEQENFLEKAIDEPSLIKALLAFGYDPKNSPDKGASALWEAKDPETYALLIQAGATFTTNRPHMELIETILEKLDRKPLTSDWSSLIKSLIEKCGPSEIGLGTIYKLITLSKAAPCFKAPLAHLLNSAINSLPEKLLIHYFSDFFSTCLYNPFLFFIFGKEEKVYPQFLEKILLSPPILNANFCDLSSKQEELKDCLGKILSEETRHLIDLSGGDFMKGIFLAAFLQTSSLKSASTLLKRIPKELPQTCANTVLMHIKSLERKEKKWLFDAARGWDITFPFELKTLGFDLYEPDPSSGKNILFTRFAKHFGGSKVPKKALLQRDRDGNNALEWHCKSPIELGDTGACLEVCTSLGLTLSDSFPESGLCRSLFPEDPLLQAALATLLLQKETQGSWQLMIYNDRQKNTFKKTVQSHPEVFKRIRNYFIKERYQRDPNWRSSHFSSEAQDALESLSPREIKDLSHHVAQSKESIKCEHQRRLMAIEALFSKEISLEELTMHPVTPRAALTLLALEENKKGAPTALLFDHLTRDDLLSLAHHLFNHPEKMPFITSRMQVEEIHIAAEGSAISTFAESIFPLLEGVKELKTMRKRQKNDSLSEKIKRLELPLPYPVRSISLSALPLSFRVKAPQETVADLKKIYAVAKIFSENCQRFETFFPMPQAILLTSQLPEELRTTSEKKGPYYLIPFAAIPLPHGESRKAMLSDIGKMLRRGLIPFSPLPIFPGLKAPSFLLYDLYFLMLQGEMRFKRGKEVRGARSIFLPDLEALPNFGGADLISSNPIEALVEALEWGSKKGKSHDTLALMTHLSSALFLDLLYVAGAMRAVNALQWQEESCIKKLALELKSAYEILSSSYSNTPMKEWTLFTEKAELDWEKAARQIAFWLDDSDQGYPPHVRKGSLPEVLYGPRTKLLVDSSFIPFSKEGREPLCFTEFEKIAYTFVIALLRGEKLSIEPLY